jgi:DNA-binding MarR family transcriptional regulator
MNNEVDWQKSSEFEGPEHSPGFLLWQVSTQWRRKIENALSAIGLTHPQFVLLASVAWLSRHGSLATQAELARHCKTDVNMTSQVLRTLAKKGYIERVQQKGDERSKYSRVTDEGKQLIEQALPLVESVDRAFFKQWQSERETGMHLLQKLLIKD